MNREWITLDKAYDEETTARASIDVNTLCVYGVKPLDDNLVCMAKNELTVIGADGGAGKSEIAINIALTNAKRGKKVILYYLEGGYYEAVSRMKWKDITQEYYKNYSDAMTDLSYRKWSLNLTPPHSVLTEIEGKLRGEYQKWGSNLYLYSRPQGLTIDMFTSSIFEFHNLVSADSFEPHNFTGELDIDLIIIDHLQYFSLTKPESEIFEITEILRTVKNITDTLKVPVVLISHLRKKTKDRGLPGQEDFYGSSNIPKIATTVISLARDNEKDNLERGVFPTYIRVAKSRIGVRPNYAYLVDFHSNTRSYMPEYKTVRLDSFGNVCEKPEG